jgi:hypothetical protein
MNIFMWILIILGSYFLIGIIWGLSFNWGFLTSKSANKRLEGFFSFIITVFFWGHFVFEILSDLFKGLRNLRKNGKKE